MELSSPSPPDPAARLTGVFSKRPAPGRVKTRLSPPLAPAQASRLAEGMLRDAVARCSASAAFRTALVYAPQEDEAWFRGAFPDLDDLRPQRGEGLGERMSDFVTTALGRPDTRTVVVIGSDQPLVGTPRIDRAHRALETGADVVLGPDAGGGYYLIGLRAPQPRLFSEVTMSTRSMFDATRAVAESDGLSVHVLEPGYDVDVEADLVRLREDLERWEAAGGAADPEFPRHTRASLRELFPVSS